MKVGFSSLSLCLGNATVFFRGRLTKNKALEDVRFALHLRGIRQLQMGGHQRLAACLALDPPFLVLVLLGESGVLFAGDHSVLGDNFEQLCRDEMKMGGRITLFFRIDTLWAI